MTTVLYDADCALCEWLAARLRRVDRARKLEFVALQDATAIGDRPDLAGIAARHDLPGRIHAIAPDGSVSAGGRALLAIGDRLPGAPLVRAWARIPGSIWLLELGYRFVARNRGLVGRLLGAGPCAACDARDRDGTATPACNSRRPARCRRGQRVGHNPDP